VIRVESDDFFVVLADGIQRIGEVAANLIRSLDSQGRHETTSVSPDFVNGLPIVDPLPVSTYPRRAGATMGARDGGVLCATWLPGPKTVLWKGDSLPTVANPMALAQGDGEGPEIDSVVMPSGRSAFVRAASLVRDNGGGGPLYLVTDSGVVFGIRDEATAKVLGIQGDSVAAPWPVLSRLPSGPELNRDNALVARDSVTVPP
jgi:type VII secretion protein EccB